MKTTGVFLPFVWAMLILGEHGPYIELIWASSTVTTVEAAQCCEDRNASD